MIVLITNKLMSDVVVPTNDLESNTRSIDVIAQCCEQKYIKLRRLVSWGNKCQITSV